jgi:hypothetical protein
MIEEARFMTRDKHERTGSGAETRVELEQDSGPLPQPAHRPQPARACDHHRTVRRALAADLARLYFGYWISLLLVIPAAGFWSACS